MKMYIIAASCNMILQEKYRIKLDDVKVNIESFA